MLHVRHGIQTSMKSNQHFKKFERWWQRTNSTREGVVPSLASTIRVISYITTLRSMKYWGSTNNYWPRNSNATTTKLGPHLQYCIPLMRIGELQYATSTHNNSYTFFTGIWLHTSVTDGGSNNWVISLQLYCTPVLYRVIWVCGSGTTRKIVPQW